MVSCYNPAIGTLSFAQLIGPAVKVPLLLFGGMALAIVLLAVILWSVKKRADPRVRINPPSTFSEVCESITGLTHSYALEGNKVSLLQNGDGFFPPLEKDLQSAKKSIHFETFLWKDGELSNRLTGHFIAAARRGVEVRMLLDGNGGKVTKDQKKRLKEAGVKLFFYHPWNVGSLGHMNNRDHRKIVVIDGAVAYVGGHCIVDSWLGKGQDKEHFRDISVKVRGPVVHSIQSTFSENWVDRSGEVFVGDIYFPKLESEGDCKVHVARVNPSGTISSVKLLHHLVIECSREKIRIQNPYFLPDPEAIEGLCRAVKRGVDVQVMLPSADASDNPMVQHASHHRFGALLKGGVRIFEYGRTLLHQKVMSIDGVWGAVGSTNFDDRSFELNDEITLGIWDETLARELEKTFEQDLKECKEVSMDEWLARGFFHKLKDGSFFMINEQL